LCMQREVDEYMILFASFSPQVQSSVLRNPNTRTRKNKFEFQVHKVHVLRRIYKRIAHVFSVMFCYTSFIATRLGLGKL